MVFLFRGRKGISEMIAYALLIALALSLSMIVYVWLKTYVMGDVESCPEDLSVVITNYECDSANNKINITFQNKGLFTAKGLLLKASNTTGIAIWNLKNSSGGEDDVYKGFVRTGDFNSNDKQKWIFSYAHLNILNTVEIEPYIYDKKGEILLCDKAAITEPVGCG